MINRFNYVDALKIINEDIQYQKTDSDFLEIFDSLDLILREILEAEDLKFTTVRSRFLYLADKDNFDKTFIRYASVLFNIHYKMCNFNYKLKPDDLKLLKYVFVMIYNKYSQDKLDYPADDFLKEYKIEYEAIQKKSLDCYFKSSKKIKDNDGVSYIELTVTDDFGDDLKIYLNNKIFIHNKMLSDMLSITSNKDFYVAISDFFITDRKIRFFNLSKSEKGFYFQNQDTVFIIEPDFLIDITAIAECFQNNQIIPELFFLKFIETTTYNVSLFKGALVNYLLDRVITNHLTGYKSDDDSVFFSNFYKIFFLKILDFEEKTLNNILKDVKENHLPNLIKTKENFKNKDEYINLEPAFISEEYGIQGRLDALIESVNDINKKTILELKSGKPPKSHLWQNHYAQVTGYNLLMESVFGINRTGYSMILYSGAESEPLRNVTFSQSTANLILMCRNSILNDLLKFTTESQSLDNIFIKLKKRKLPSFLQSKLTEYFHISNRMDDYEIIYLNALISFTMRELSVQKTGGIDDSGLVRYGHSALWSLSYEEKKKQNIIISNLKLEQKEDYNFIFSSTETDLSTSSFREGDVIVLYPSYDNKPKPLKVPIFKAVLTEIKTNDNLQNLIYIRLKNELISFENLTQYKTFFVEKDIMEASFYGAPSTFFNFFKNNKDKRDVFFGLKRPRIDTHCNESLLKSSNSYERILYKAKVLQDYLLIQGPPGTGKTSRYLMSIVNQHLNHNKSSIVIVAFTNRAVDEICSKLLNTQIDFLLLGTKNCNEDFHIKSLIDYDFDYISKRLKNTKVFVSTVANYQNEGIFLNKYIDTDLLIVDEASQLLETQLIGIISEFKRFILIGDHFQLPAVSTQNISNTSSVLQDKLSLKSLKQSLFERLFHICQKNNYYEAFDMLPEHYRMHSEIAELINYFYDNKLKANNTRQFQDFTYYKNIPDQSSIITLLANSRCIFCNTIENKTVRYNHEEAEKIYKIISEIHSILKDEFNESSIGVICSWRMQVNTIKQKINCLEYSNLITIDTVERFQGSERDIIIYSTALADAMLLKKMQSLTDDLKVDRKLNVAISRAKEQFILLGNKEVLSNSVHYKNVIEKMQEIRFN